MHAYDVTSLEISHTWNEHHPINRPAISIIDQSSKLWNRKILEALYIQMSNTDELFNRDIGMDLPLVTSLLLGHS